MEKSLGAGKRVEVAEIRGTDRKWGEEKRPKPRKMKADDWI